MTFAGKEAPAPAAVTPIFREILAYAAAAPLGKASPAGYRAVKPAMSN